MEEKKTNILEKDLNGDNIEEAINNSSKVTDEIAQKAAEKIAERRKEKLTEQLISVVQKCEFTVAAAVLQVRRSNRTNQRIKTYLKEISALAEDIKSGKKPVIAWSEEAIALKRQYDKDLIEIGKEIDSCREKLNEIFPESWTWRYSELVPGK